MTSLDSPFHDRRELDASGVGGKATGRAKDALQVQFSLCGIYFLTFTATASKTDGRGNADPEK